MKFNTLTRRAAAAGALTALTASGLVAATTVAANAAPVTNTYTCATSFGSRDVTLTSDPTGIEGFDGVLAAGQAAPGSALPLETTFTISDSFHSELVGVGIDDLAVPDFAGTFGNTTVPVSGITAKVSEMTQNGDTTWTGSGTTGLNDAFTAPSGGDHAVVAPATFTIVATLGANQVPATCTAQGTPGTYATLTVNKNVSKLTASSNSPVPHGKKAVLKAKVKAPNHTPTGKVLFKDGTKKLARVSLNARGLAVLKTKLSKGKHTIKMIYKGDSYTTGSKGSTKVVQK